MASLAKAPHSSRNRGQQGPDFNSSDPASLSSERADPPSPVDSLRHPQGLLNHWLILRVPRYSTLVLLTSLASRPHSACEHASRRSQHERRKLALQWSLCSMHNTLTTELLCIDQTVRVQHDDQGLYSEWLVRTKSYLLMSLGEYERPIIKLAQEKTSPKEMKSYIAPKLKILNAKVEFAFTSGQHTRRRWIVAIRSSNPEHERCLLFCDSQSQIISSFHNLLRP